MPAFHYLVRPMTVFVVLASAILLIGSFGSKATRIAFDLPGIIECRDVTPDTFASSHPALKVVEAKFRVSARLLAGKEDDIVDLLYVLVCPDMRARFQDYLPNTTLESTLGDDVIEVTETTETTRASDLSARVGYKSSGGGVGTNKSTKKTASNHYKQIAPKALVLASGTTEREHGVFFKLKPSKSHSLEGAREFTFLATVPKTWRGGWCTLSCAGRATAKTLLSKGVAPAGVEQAHVGLCLAGDAEASALAEELYRVQRAHAAVLSSHLAQHGNSLVKAMYSQISSDAMSDGTLGGNSICTTGDSDRKTLAEARQAILDVQNRLDQLSE